MQLWKDGECFPVSRCTGFLDVSVWLRITQASAAPALFGGGGVLKTGPPGVVPGVGGTG